ncbi:calsequestrin-1-like [Acipenser ruthenus]|uniref:calsequestrin-1-like n=1 Tax=Acipenser ruthenus TaxID=7906 RepID=UPI002740A61C|nr:calsequestrin-1-like [Acipenser ruthenus]
MRSDKQFIEDPMEFIEEERELRAFLNIEDEIKVVENSKSENSEQDNVSKRENESMRSDEQFIEDPMEFIEEERELLAFLNIEDEIKVVENSKSENSEQDNVSKRENESMRSDEQFIEDPMEFIEEERELRAFLNIEDEIKVVENSKSENSERTYCEKQQRG